MQRLKSLNLLLGITALSTFCAAAALAQTSDYTQSQPAPIERSAPSTAAPQSTYGPQGYGQPSGVQAMPRRRPAPRVTESEPAPGIYLRKAAGATVTDTSKSPDAVELSVTRGKADVTVRHPKDNAQILVDLPGGQVALIKDGLYTFNAETHTVRVLEGEAEGFPSASSSAKGIKIKEDHQLVFAGANVRSIEVDPAQLRADLLPGAGGGSRGDGYGYGYAGGYPAYDYGPYGDGFYGGYPYGYGYPYYAWDYPYGYGYPFGIGLGFGYGFYGGYGFRGGFGGFHGRR